jgi:hypothetical protein
VIVCVGLLLSPFEVSLNRGVPGFRPPGPLVFKLKKAELAAVARCNKMTV